MRFPSAVVRLPASAAAVLAAALAPGAPAGPPAAYRLPFAEGEARVCTQGRDGETHRGILAFAVDFAMPEGSPVCAARAGRVAAVWMDGRAGGSDPDAGLHANYIHIEHADGTVGRYLHLKAGGALVRVGDYVCRGQPLGASGSTGLSSGPHLHFDVWQQGTTIPFRFEEVEGAGGVPQAGQGYVSRNARAIPPDAKASLDEVFRTAEFYLRFGACHLAYPCYLRIAALKLDAEYEPLRLGRERIRELEERVRGVAEEAGALAREGKPLDALERLAYARYSFNGLPGTHRLQQLYEELSRGAEGRERLDGLRDPLKALELFCLGLQSEAGGRPEAAARHYRQILASHGGAPSAELARARLQELESRAPERGGEKRNGEVGGGTPRASR